MRSPPNDRWVTRSPCLLHESMCDAPAVRGANNTVVVVAADDERVATVGTGEYMLALQLAAVRSFITIHGHLMIADEVLGGIEAQDGAANAGFDGVAAVAGHTVEHAGRIGGEDIIEAIDVAGVESPGVGDCEFDNGGAVIHHASVSHRIGIAMVGSHTLDV